MSVFGLPKEVVVLKNKRIKWRAGHIPYGLNFELDWTTLKRYHKPTQIIVVYSYNNPTKIKDQVIFARLNIYK